MYAVQLQDDPTATSVSPGPIAKLVGGNFGLVIIIIAGWSTANPVIYSSGLALQHIFPKIHAWMSTLIVGTLATAVACFPAITNYLIEFLSIAGILLCPMGVIVYSDHFLLPKFGLQSEYSHRHMLLKNDAGNNEEDYDDVCRETNWPAVITWSTAEILTLPLALLTPVTVYFAPILTIGWSFIVYIGLTKLFVAKGWMVYAEIITTTTTGDDNNDDDNKALVGMEMAIVATKGSENNKTHSDCNEEEEDKSIELQI